MSNIKLKNTQKDYLIKIIDSCILIKLYVDGVKEFELELYKENTKYFRDLKSQKIYGIFIIDILTEFNLLEYVEKMLKN